MQTTSRIAIAAAMLVLAAAVSTAAASEGQAGGGVPITFCGQVVTTNAFLTGSRNCGGTHGVVVGADGVTIDLKGFTLRGDRSLGHYGIFDVGHDGLRVRNGVVRGFDLGVAAYGGADNVSVSNLLVSGNASNGIYVGGNAASVKSSAASGNDGAGITVSGDSVKIQSSTASGNVTGIYVISGSASVKSSTASGNLLDGIIVTGNSASVKSSTASGNAFNGIAVVGDAPVVTGNRAEANGFAGGASDNNGRGIVASGYSTAPVGTNVARGNDDASECYPASLC